MMELLLLCCLALLIARLVLVFRAPNLFDWLNLLGWELVFTVFALCLQVTSMWERYSCFPKMTSSYSVWVCYALFAVTAVLGIAVALRRRKTAPAPKTP